MLRLIKLWLKAPIEERDGDGKRRMRFTACSEPPMFQETVHVDVGEQWACDAALRRAAGVALPTTHAPLPVTIPFLDRRFQPQLDQPSAIRRATDFINSL